MTHEWVELSTAIQVLREQLLTAKAAGENSEVSFAVGKVEVELGLEVRRSAGGGGKLQFGVFALDGKGEYSSGTTHRLRLELLPRDRHGKTLEIKGQVDELPSR
ncbi:trypco2 family protein [Streptomyces sp. NPDC001070]